MFRILSLILLFAIGSAFQTLQAQKSISIKTTLNGDSIIIADSTGHVYKIKAPTKKKRKKVQGSYPGPACGRIFFQFQADALTSVPFLTPICRNAEVSSPFFGIIKEERTFTVLEFVPCCRILHGEPGSRRNILFLLFHNVIPFRVGWAKVTFPQLICKRSPQKAAYLPMG